MKKSNPAALAPIGVFLVLYLGLGVLFEYVLKIPMGFYNIPIVVAFLAAILVACTQNKEKSFDEKLGIIEKEYSIVVDNRIREDVSAMCNLSQGIREKGGAEREETII